MCELFFSAPCSLFCVLNCSAVSGVLCNVWAWNGGKKAGLSFGCKRFLLWFSLSFLSAILMCRDICWVLWRSVDTEKRWSNNSSFSTNSSICSGSRSSKSSNEVKFVVLYRVLQKKNAQSLMHHNFMTVSRRVTFFCQNVKKLLITQKSPPRAMFTCRQLICRCVITSGYFAHLHTHFSSFARL